MIGATQAAEIVQLNEATLNAIADAVIARQNGNPFLKPELTTDEAVAYTKNASRWAFYRWAQENGVRRIRRNRYRRARLDRAMGGAA